MPTPKWVKGQSGNPKGRPKGSGNRLAENVLAALKEHFDENGLDAVQRVWTESPAEYLRVIASVLPREVIITNDALEKIEKMDDDELRLHIAGLEQTPESSSNETVTH